MSKSSMSVARAAGIGALRGVTGQAFGLEIEMEGTHLGGELRERPGEVWFTHDGSLRQGGIEYLTAPANLADTIERARWVYDLRDRAGWTYGPRCGIHVHMDMSQRTCADVQRVAVAYALVEPLFFALCGEEREANIFCVPWYRAPGDLRMLRDFLYAPSKVGTRPLRAMQKYTAMYAEPLRRFGTLEFRGAPVFQDVNDLGTLVQSFDSLIRQAEGWDVDDLIEAGIDAPEYLAHALVPELADHWELIEDVDTPGVAMNLVRTKPGTAWQAYGVPDEPPEDAFVPGERARRAIPVDVGLMEMELRMDLERQQPRRPRRLRVGD